MLSLARLGMEPAEVVDGGGAGRHLGLVLPRVAR